MRIPNPVIFVPDNAFVMTVIILFSVLIKPVNANEVIFKKSQLILNGEEYLLEIAQSVTQRRRGLMFRKHLDERQGMLFIFPRSGDHRIWMKNTLIPLTVIWLDEKNEIISVKKLLPCTSDPCPVYGVSKSSKYILELSGGNHDLKPGLKIDGLARMPDTSGDAGVTR
jgi:uncharacterized membrane protein (UPF0127 family)